MEIFNLIIKNSLSFKSKFKINLDIFLNNKEKYLKYKIY
jgi:hypothetical protein